MKYLKYFESQEEVTLRQKLESIVDFADYLWLIDASDGLENYYGECSTLFLGCLEHNSGWKRRGKKPYEFNVDCLIQKFETSFYKKDEKLELIEKLYKTSIIPRFKNTVEEIKKILEPISELKVLGYKIIESIEIFQHYNWLKKPCFKAKIEINEDELSIDREDIKRLFIGGREYGIEGDKKKFREVEKEFYRIKSMVKSEISKIDFISHGLKIENDYDSSTFGDLSTISLILQET